MQQCTMNTMPSRTMTMRTRTTTRTLTNNLILERTSSVANTSVATSNQQPGYPIRPSADNVRRHHDFQPKPPALKETNYRQTINHISKHNRVRVKMIRCFHYCHINNKEKNVGNHSKNCFQFKVKPVTLSFQL